jgi:hypothetical protein
MIVNQRWPNSRWKHRMLQKQAAGDISTGVHPRSTRPKTVSTDTRLFTGCDRRRKCNRQTGDTAIQRDKSNSRLPSKAWIQIYRATVQRYHLLFTNAPWSCKTTVRHVKCSNLPGMRVNDGCQTKTYTFWKVKSVEDYPIELKTRSQRFMYFKLSAIRFISHINDF